MKRLISLCLCFVLALNLLIAQPARAREISKAGEVFQKVKDGVVTVVISYAHGSGFLVDSSGLVVTNSHVVNEAGDDVRIRFGPGEILRGTVLENDRASDVAVVWVNLKNIKKYTVLEPFTPESGDSLAMVGENILAVGSPVEWHTLEKTMTTGVVGKYQNDVIFHDAAINGGNSGGPLFNYDGRVIGINTFGRSDRGQAIGGCVAINKALPLLESAKGKMATLPPPSPELLPDASPIAFPIQKLLDAGGKELPSTKRNYNFDSQYFAFSVVTPPQGYKALVDKDKRVLAKRKKRARRKGFEVKDDEYESKNLVKFYDYNKPVVTIVATPKPKLTTGSKIFNTASFVAAAGLAVATYGLVSPLVVAPFTMGKREVKKDFLKLRLENAQSQSVCSPLTTGRAPFSEDIAILTQTTYQSFIDKSYIGRYEFDAKCFEGTEPLSLVVETEGDDKQLRVDFSQKVRKYIVEDFAPYWKHVAEMTGKEPVATAPGTVSPKTVEPAQIVPAQAPSAQSIVSGQSGVSTSVNTSAERKKTETKSFETPPKQDKAPTAPPESKS